MKKGSTRWIACLLAVGMLLGLAVVFPMTSTAYNYSDGAAVGTGTTVPTGVAIYSGSYSEVTGLTTDDDGVYLINTPEEFMYFQANMAATAVATDVFRLTCDIAINNEDYGPHGSNYVFSCKAFAGTLDGGNHKIYNSYGWSISNLPLFATMSGTVKDLIFISSRITNTNDSSPARAAAVVCSTLTGTVENVHIQNLYLKGTYAGGIAVDLNAGGVIRNCSVSGQIITTHVGGAFAAGISTSTTDGVTIENCVSNAVITGDGKGATNSNNNNSIIAVGGFIGRDNSGGSNKPITYKNCVNNTTIQITHGENAQVSACYVGGFLGYGINGCETIFENCTNNANITVSSIAEKVAAAGFVGTLPYSAQNGSGQGAQKGVTFINCVNNGNIVSNGTAAGLIGYTRMAAVTAVIQNSANYGTVTGSKIAGGMVGRMFGHELTSGNAVYSGGIVKLINSENLGDVTSDEIAGGVVGEFTVYCYSKGNKQQSRLIVENYYSDADVFGGTHASAVIGFTNYYNGTQKENISLTNTHLGGTVSTTSGKVAAFSAGSSIGTNSALPIYNEIDAALFPIVTAVDSHFNIVFSVNGSPVSAVSRYTPDGTAGTNGYNDATESGTTAAYPAYAGNSFAADALTALNKTNTTPWVESKGVPTMVTALGFHGATMSLGGDMSLNIKLNQNVFSAFGEGVTNLQFVNMDGFVAVAPTAEDGYYTVSYTGIRAAELTEKMHLYISVNINGTTYTSANVLVYSPADYLSNIYTAYASDVEVKAVVETMFKYGAEAEAKAENKTADETDAYAQAFAAGIALPDAFAATGYTDSTANTEEDNAVVNTYVREGIGAALTGGIALSLNGMTPNTVVQVQIRDEIKTYIADENGVVYLDMIYADMITDHIILIFDHTATATITVGNFLELRNTGEEAALAQATILYMLAVRAYANTH